MLSESLFQVAFVRTSHGMDFGKHQSQKGYPIF